jgi:hypothetical protein
VVGGIDALKFTASSRCAGAADLLREALDVVSPDEKATRARLRGRLALQHVFAGSRSEALAGSAEAIADARSSGDREALVHSLIARHAVVFGPDHMAERCAIAREILDHAVALGSLEFEMRAHALHVTNLFDQGEIDAMDAAIEHHARLAEKTSDPFERWVNMMWHSARAVLIGHFAEADRLSHQALEWTRSVPGPHAFELNGPMGWAAQRILIQEAQYSGVPDAEVIEHYRARHPEVSAWQVALLHRVTRLGLVEEARREIDSLCARDFVSCARNGTWLAAMSYLTDAVALTADQERAAVLYPMLLPYSDLTATISFISTRGSVSRSLGLLAATMGNVKDATRHFDAALAKNRRMGARPLVAVTLLDYGRFLARVSNHRGRELVGEGLSIARELGMEGLIRECEEQLVEQRGRESKGAATAPAHSVHLTRSGHFWTLSHGGQTVLLKHAKGLTYLAELLRHPDRDIHALDLLALVAEAPDDDPSAATADADNLVVGTQRVTAEDVIDAKARRAYRRQLSALEDQLQAAEKSGEPERVLTLREELRSVRRELARATALGGRPRRASDAERARISVTRTIRLALTRIAEVSPELGGELARRIRTGTFCRYASAGATSGAPEVGRER